MFESYSITNLLVFLTLVLGILASAANYFIWRRMAEENPDEKSTPIWVSIIALLLFMPMALFVLMIQLEDVDSFSGIPGEISWLAFIPCAICPSYLIAIMYALIANGERKERQRVADLERQGIVVKPWSIDYLKPKNLGEAVALFFGLGSALIFTLFLLFLMFG